MTIDLEDTFVQLVQRELINRGAIDPVAIGQISRSSDDNGLTYSFGHIHVTASDREIRNNAVVDNMKNLVQSRVDAAIERALTS